MAIFVVNENIVHLLAASPLRHTEISYFYESIVFDFLTILLLIREIRGSNLGPDTGCPDRFCDFLQSLQENIGIVP